LLLWGQQQKAYLSWKIPLPQKLSNPERILVEVCTVTE
jgi:hypothetical protein